MRVYIGSDHGGVTQKAALVLHLAANKVAIRDCGSYDREATDYPDYALAVARSVRSDPGSFGILLCRSGEGMEMAANKVPGIRAALVWRPEVAVETRNDNDANILVLPSDFVTDQVAMEIADTFLGTPFSALPRHQRRLEKMQTIERMPHEA